MKVFHWFHSVVGMTLTGAAKYTEYINRLEPKIVILEEAAECLEVFSTAVLIESLEHLILIGDH